MAPNKKKKNKLAQDPLSEGASGGGEGVPPQQLGIRSPKGKTSFADLQEQSTLHLEADVKSNGVLKLWSRKTLLVTKGVLYVCKNKSNGWSEKKVLLGKQTEVKIVAPDKKNVNRHQLILTGRDKSKTKVALDSVNDQGALAKALEEEGAIIDGMDSILLYKAFCSNLDSRNRNALLNNGSEPVICVSATSDDPNDPDINSVATLSTVGGVAENNSFAIRSTSDASNIYGDLHNKSSNLVFNDLSDGKTVNAALTLDDSFYTSLEGEEDSSSHEFSTNEPSYRNHEVKLYKQNLRLKKESEIYDKLDHGYGKQKNLIMPAEPHRPAPAVNQNLVLNSQKQLSVAESINELTDDDLYETTIQIGEHVSRMNSVANDTSSSSPRPESSQTDECSLEGNPRTRGYDTPSLISNGEQARKNTAVILSVKEVELVSDEVKDRSEPALESLGEKNDNGGATERPEVTMKSQVETLESNANNKECDQPVTTLETQGEVHELNANDGATDQFETTFETRGEERDSIYGTIDRESYGTLYLKKSETNHSSTGIFEDSAGKLSEDEGVGIYDSIWKTSGQSEGSNFQEAEVEQLIAEHQQSDDVCKDSESKSFEHDKMKSDILGGTEFSTQNENSLSLEEIPVQIELKGIVIVQNSGESYESLITHSSNSLEEDHNANAMQEEESTTREEVSLTNNADYNQEVFTDNKNSANNPEETTNFKQSQDGDDGKSNGSQSSLSLKDDELLNTFVERVTETYGSDSVMSMNADSKSDNQNNEDEEVEFDELVDIYDDDPLGEKNDNNDLVQKNGYDDRARYQEDNNEWDLPDVRHDDQKAADHIGSPEGDINSQSFDGIVRAKDYNLSELLGAITDNSNEPNSDNNLTPTPYFEYPNVTSTQDNPSVGENGLSNVRLPAATAEHVSEADMDIKRENKSLTIKIKQIDNEDTLEDKSRDQLSVEQSNDEFVDHDMEDETKGTGNLFYDVTTFPNNGISTSHDNEINDSYGQNDTEIILEKSNQEKDTASCLAARTSSKKTKKKVRFCDDIQVQCLEDIDHESEYDSVFSDGDDDGASGENYSNDNISNDDNDEMEDNFETQESNSEIQQDFDESTVPSTIEPMKSMSSSKLVENSSDGSFNAGGSTRVAVSRNSRLQQPSKVVLPALGEGSGKNKTTSSSAILLEPNSGTCLVDYSRGGRHYQRRVLKMEDGLLHFFSSPQEENRRGSHPEPGDVGETNCLMARPVHTVELGKSSVVPGLMADGEGLYSITLTLAGGKTALLKSPNREEQMKLVFLLSDEVMRVTPPRDRDGLILYPSKVKEPNNELEDTVKLSASPNVQLSASPKVNSNSGTVSPASAPPRLPEFTQNESIQPVNREPLTKTHTKGAERNSVVMVSPHVKLLSETTNSSEKQLLWQNILKNRTTNFGPEGFVNKAVPQSSSRTPSPSTPHSPEESVSHSAISSSGLTKANVQTLLSGTSLKPVSNRVNGVDQNVVPNKFRFPMKQTNGHKSQHNSETSPVSKEINKRMRKTDDDIPVTGSVSSLRLIFESESVNNNGFHSLPSFRHFISKTQNFTYNNQRKPRSMSLDNEPNNMDLNRRQNLVFTPFNRRVFDGQAPVPEEVLGAYARPPSIVIKELHDDSSPVEEGGADLPVRSWWDSRTGGFRRDSFGATRQAGLGAKRGTTTSVNYLSLTVEEVAEAINPVLKAKRLIMDSKMVVVDIRRTRDHLANRVLEQWELAQQMDEGQRLDKKMAEQQVALLQQELQQLQATLKQEKRHQKGLRKQLKQRVKEE